MSRSLRLHLRLHGCCLTGIYYKLFANAPGHGKYVPLVAGLLGGFFVVLLAVCITVGILYHRRYTLRLP